MYNTKLRNVNIQNSKNRKRLKVKEDLKLRVVNKTNKGVVVYFYT